MDDSFVDESSYPVQACDYILENIDLENARFYNEYNYGSYMLFRGIPVFIDSRADLLRYSCSNWARGCPGGRVSAKAIAFERLSRAQF